MGFFDDLFGDVEVESPELTETQAEIERIFLDGLRRADVETGELTGFILNSMGFTTGDDGELRRLTDEEYIGTLPEAQQQNYRNLSLQVERQRLALEGNLPVSEGLRQQKVDQFRVFKEAMARKGNIITGDDPGTATANTTAGIQSLNSFNDRFALAEDTERRGEIQTGQANINQNMGLISNLRQKNVEQLSTTPARNLFASNIFAGQSGLLSRQSLANAQFDANAQEGNLKTLGTIFGLF